MFARMLVAAVGGEAHSPGILAMAVAMVAGMSLEDPFLWPKAEEENEGGDGTIEALQAVGGELEAGALARDRMLGGPQSKADESAADEARVAAQAKARIAISKWLDSESDALALLKAGGAYACNGGSSAFCRRSMLHEKTMRQVVQLRVQLSRVVNRVLNPTTQLPVTVVGEGLLPPPTPKQRDVLRQVILAGMVHQVARLVAPGDHKNVSLGPL